MRTLWYDGERLTVYTAGPFYVLVMKLFSARMSPLESDVEDVALLMGVCGYSTSRELQELARDLHHRNVAAVRHLPENLAAFCDLATATYNALYGRPTS